MHRGTRDHVETQLTQPYQENSNKDFLQEVTSKMNPKELSKFS